MARIIRQSSRETREEYHLAYPLLGEDRGVGYSFPCDSSGNVDHTSLLPEGLANLSRCETGIGTFVEQPIVMRNVHTWRRSALLECDCKREVLLSGFTNACPCGRDYNASGSLLAPRSQWGEETGEHPSDILRIR